MVIGHIVSFVKYLFSYCATFKKLSCLLFIIFLLKYSWFTMLCQFLPYSKVTQSYLCMYEYVYTQTHRPFLILLSILGYPKRLDIVPCASVKKGSNILSIHTMHLLNLFKACYTFNPGSLRNRTFSLDVAHFFCLFVCS